MAPHSHKSDISQTIWHSDENYPSLSSLSVTLETIEDSEAGSLGTGDLLRKFSHLLLVSLLHNAHLHEANLTSSFLSSTQDRHNSASM